MSLDRFACQPRAVASVVLDEMSFLRIVIALACAALLLAVPAASAQDNSAVDEYTENPPSPGGENPNPDGGAGSGGSDGSGGGGGESSLPPATVDQLESMGADGAAAAGLANELGPTGNRDRNGSGGSSPGSGSVDPATGESAGGSPISEILEGLTGGSDSSGLGPVLPIVLIAALIAGLAFALARRRRGDTPDAPAA